MKACDYKTHLHTLLGGMRKSYFSLLDRGRDLDDGMFRLGWCHQRDLLVAHQMLRFHHQLLDCIMRGLALEKVR